MMLQIATSINTVLSEAVQKDQAAARMMLELMLHLSRYLRRQGIAIRGHGNRGGNLWLLMMERAASLPKERQWLLGRDE